MNKTVKLIPMVQFILEIDWLTTTEFCNTYGVPHPKFTGEIKSSVNNLLQVDAIKHRMFVEHAKLLNKNITPDILTKNLGFESVDVRGGCPIFENGKYSIMNDNMGFLLKPYDSFDGRRISKLIDMETFGLTYTKD